jgi:hypothetical protein
MELDFSTSVKYYPNIIRGLRWMIGAVPCLADYLFFNFNATVSSLGWLNVMRHTHFDKWLKPPW